MTNKLNAIDLENVPPNEQPKPLFFKNCRNDERLLKIVDNLFSNAEERIKEREKRIQQLHFSDLSEYADILGVNQESYFQKDQLDRVNQNLKKAI